jgi:hypothetical protein
MRKEDKGTEKTRGQGDGETRGRGTENRTRGQGDGETRGGEFLISKFSNPQILKSANPQILP